MKYPNKILVKCYTCGKEYTKNSDNLLYYQDDGSECNCKDNGFVIIKEIKGVIKNELPIE